MVHRLDRSEISLFSLVKKQVIFFLVILAYITMVQVHSWNKVNCCIFNVWDGWPQGHIVAQFRAKAVFEARSMYQGQTTSPSILEVILLVCYFPLQCSKTSPQSMKLRWMKLMSMWHALIPPEAVQQLQGNHMLIVPEPLPQHLSQDKSTDECGPLPTRHGHLTQRCSSLEEAICWRTTVELS